MILKCAKLPGCDDREDFILLCDGCGNGFHYDTCLEVSLSSVPEGDWFYYDCGNVWLPNGPM